MTNITPSREDTQIAHLKTVADKKAKQSFRLGLIMGILLAIVALLVSLFVYYNVTNAGMREAIGFAVSHPKQVLQAKASYMELLNQADKNFVEQLSRSLEVK